MSWTARFNNFLSRLFGRRNTPIWQGHTRSLPGVRMEDVPEAAKRLLELGMKSTWVNGWYSHRYSNEPGYAATVRGPFCRWLCITDGGGWDEKKGRPPYVAEPGDDADFIAHALNNAESIARAYLQLRYSIDNPELLENVSLKIQLEDLKKEYAILHNKYGRSFTANCDSHRVIEHLTHQSHLAKDLVRLLKEGKPIPSAETLERMFSEEAR